MPAGHSAFALMFFSMVAGLVPGFWAAWIFCGLDFLLFLALFPSLFMTCRKNRFEAGAIEVSPVVEGETATVQVQVTERRIALCACESGRIRNAPVQGQNQEAWRLYGREGVSLDSRNHGHVAVQRQGGICGTSGLPETCENIGL